MITKIYEANYKHKEIGLRFYYSEQKEPIADFNYQDSYIIEIFEGEIKLANATYSNIHDIRDNSSECSWNTVEEVLYTFMNKSFDEFVQIVEKLDRVSVGYSIVKKIVNHEKEELEKQLNIFASLLK